MKTFLLSAILLLAILARGAPIGATGPFECQAELKSQNKIDELVFGRLERLGIRPANVCSDAVFVRRAYLDVIGTLPTVPEVSQFLMSREPNKRSHMIERLLAREEFADYWAMKWSDVLRVKAEFPINLWPNAAQAYHRWIRTCIKENMPYDRFAREMLTASGSNFRVPQVNFYRAMQNKEPQAIAQTVALTFMGVRADKWPKERLSGMAAFFLNVGYKQTSEWKEEIVFFDPGKTNTASTAGPAEPIFPDGTPARLVADRDPREVFADWLVCAKNPWFTRNIANRVWFWLLGRGIVHEPDDIRPDNPPSNPELLLCLEQELVDSHYDLKRLYRLILNSKTYQLSSINPVAADVSRRTQSRTELAPTNRRIVGQASRLSPGRLALESTNAGETPVVTGGTPAPLLAQDDLSLSDAEREANFAQYPLRRLEAEVLIDALNQVTGTTEKYTSPIPEPFTFIPEHLRSIALPDSSVTSPFLEMFGRPSRDTGLESERNNRPTASQCLHLLNSRHVQGKLEESPNLRNLLESKVSPREVVNSLYLMVLSRYPSDEEWKVAWDYSKDGNVKRRDTLMDLAWALINNPEFLYRH